MAQDVADDPIQLFLARNVTGIAMNLKQIVRQLTKIALKDNSKVKVKPVVV